jgi:hypothetical protein
MCTWLSKYHSLLLAGLHTSLPKLLRESFTKAWKCSSIFSNIPRAVFVYVDLAGMHCHLLDERLVKGFVDFLFLVILPQVFVPNNLLTPEKLTAAAPPI